MLCDSNVYPSGLAEAATCAPTCPAAPALVSTTTGCLRIGSIAAASGRVTRSLMPPGGNALMMVMACEGKASCAECRSGRECGRGGPDDETTAIHMAIHVLLLEPGFPG